MPNENVHLSDHELLLSADGELSRHRAAKVRAHLATCWACRARMAEIEGTIVDFARAYGNARNLKLPSVDGPRALLQAQLTELAAKSKVGSWLRFFWVGSTSRTAMYAGIALFLIVVVGKLALQHFVGPVENSTLGAIELGAVPDLNLTPGATRTVTINEICSMAHEDVVREVPAFLRKQILQEYRITNVRAEDYEIDYLITPGLGGAEDVHNLWPQPKFLTWNAHVKDTLEEHLHEMVCAGKLDLSTAQRDIATDWIAAYKKYFQTDRPLSERSDLAATEEKRYALLGQFLRAPMLRRPAAVKNVLLFP